jgi:hypothetical protein
MQANQIKKLKVISPTAIKTGVNVPAEINPLAAAQSPSQSPSADLIPKIGQMEKTSKTPKVSKVKAKSKAPNTKQTPAAKAGAAPKTFMPKPVSGSAGFDTSAQSSPGMSALSGPTEGFE